MVVIFYGHLILRHIHTHTRCPPLRLLALPASIELEQGRSLDVPGVHNIP